MNLEGYPEDYPKECDICGADRSEDGHICRVENGQYAPYYTFQHMVDIDASVSGNVSYYFACKRCYEEFFKRGQMHLWCISREDFEAAIDKYSVPILKEPETE